MLFRLFPCLVAGLLLLSSCTLLKQGAKNNLDSGVYTTKAMHGSSEKVYMDVTEETITLYAIQKPADSLLLDSIQRKPVLYAATQATGRYAKASFVQNSFDVDVLTIPFKYRFATGGFPRQFTTQLNGGVYLGYRTDVYALRYTSNPLGAANRSINRFGFSIGGFTGVGSTAMNPWVARDRIAIEYEGVVWSKGIAAIAGLNNFTAGVAVGWDHLLDGNRKYWIYQGKPWIGIVFGLNLN